MPKWGQDRKPQQTPMPKESSSASDAEKGAAQSFKEQVAQYNELLASQPEAAADYAKSAMYANRSEYRQARGR
jgi:hypothetical protein